MLTIGLTGGIGSGKSTVAELFAALGVTIIDSDVIAREILTTQKIVIDKVVDHFGREILDTQQQLDRRKLRELIFSDTHAREWLEKLLHPLIIEIIKQQIAKLEKLNVPYCMVVIPLLIEVPESRQLVNRVLVVDAAEATQTARTARRDKLAEGAVKKILASQTNRVRRLKIADDVIYNEGDIETLQRQVNNLHQYYLSI